ncbi:MAG: large conductance mechanosensitive channel protein MscL [Pseudolysinimonas sp.]
MLKGFREFILRGNVIDLAVAVVIGAAFTGIVNGLVMGVFNPVIALIFNANDLAGAGVVLRDAAGTENDIVLSWGLVLSALIQFLLVATVVYFALIVPMNYLKRVSFAKKKDEKPVDQPPNELELLTEIRDLLRAQAAPPA